LCFGENCIGGVIRSVLASSAVDCGSEPRLGQTTDYKIGIVASLLSMQYSVILPEISKMKHRIPEPGTTISGFADNKKKMNP
jgi:hypothetical protein